jgi:TonB family protein
MTSKKIAGCRSLWLYVFFLAASVFFLVSPQSSGAQQPSVPNRKILDRIAPAYPEIARGMALAGVVKVDALVGPDGTVKTVQIKGGHPVLAQAASNAVRHWKWQPAAQESHEIVELKFSSPE